VAAHIASGGGRQIWFASVLRFSTIAARWNSSRAPDSRLDLDDTVPDHSTFSVKRHGRFRDSDLLRHVFEAVVRACMDAGLVKGEGFAADILKPPESLFAGRCSAP
jgi:hypothetical protein